MHDEDIVAWTADLPADSPDGSIALGLFNLGESQVVLDSSFEAYNIEDGTYRVKDVWTGKTVNKVKSVQSLTVEPHACVLWLLKK